MWVAIEVKMLITCFTIGKYYDKTGNVLFAVGPYRKNIGYDFPANYLS